MPRLRHFTAVAAALVAAACAETTDPRSDGPRPELNVLATTGFYFLRPTVPNAPEKFPGVFDPTRQVVVRVVCTGATGDPCPTLASFDRTAGSVRIEMERYQADWSNTNRLRLGKGNYRLEVTEGGAVLGSGDLWVVPSASDLKQVPPDHLGLVRGGVFKIRFRIETPAGGTGPVDTVIVSPDSAVVAPGQSAQFTAVAQDASGNPIGGQAVNWDSSDPNVAAVDAAGMVTAINPGRAVIRATIGGKTGSAVVRVADQLGGLPGGPAAGAISRKVPAVNPAEYDRNHPALTGFPMSFTTAVLTTTPSATIGEINAVLAEFGGRILGGYPGVPGKAGGNLVVRFPSASHASMDAIVAQLRTRPGIAGAGADHTVGPTVVPANNGAIGWIWSLLPNDDNWGMEAIKAPALWNFNDYVRKSGRRAATGVFDVGFTSVHPDLVIARNQTPTALDDHGVHVAGTIGATFDNGIGVDGVNPFADLNFFGVGSGTWAEILVQFCTFLIGSPTPTVVNVSLGYNWYLSGINTATNQAARNIASDDGLAVVACLGAVASTQALPYIVAAAGNDGAQDAQWASAWNAAALIYNMAPIIVVEAADKAASPLRAVFSNVNGHVSAPGADIKSTANSVPYLIMNGTSMAAPHVTGLVGYLTSLAPGVGAPTLTGNPLRTPLVQTGQLSVGALNPRIDAFAAAIELDRRLGGNQILRALADFDDGSSDGNRRVDAQGNLDTNEDADGDGGRGDGAVDMADFRRFRDWLLDAEQAPGLSLDGAQNTRKRDQNGDGIYPSSTTINEGDFSRGDLNGDGKIHRTATAVLGGAIGRAATDLDVLTAVFSDPIYTAAELPALLQSGDITVDATACINATFAAQIDVAVQVESDTTQVVRQRRVTVSTARELTFTVPTDPAGYAFRLAALDGAGTVLAVATGSSGPVALASDAQFRPSCSGAVGFATSSLPNGLVGSSYLAQLAGTGGNGIYTFSVVSGMPPGLGVVGNQVTGTPSQVGNFNVTLRVTSGGQSATATFPVSVSAGNQDPLLDQGNTTSKWQITFANGQCCGQALLAPGTLGPGRYQLIISSLTTCFLLLANPGSSSSSFTGTCVWNNGFPNQAISGSISPQSGSGTVAGGNGRHWIFGAFTLTRI